MNEALSALPANRLVDFRHLMSTAKNHEMPEWMDVIHVWEEVYPRLRREQGWVLSKWFDLDRMKIEWTVSDQVVIATMDRGTGLIREKLKPPKGR